MVDPVVASLGQLTGAWRSPAAQKMGCRTTGRQIPDRRGSGPEKRGMRRDYLSVNQLGVIIAAALASSATTRDPRYLRYPRCFIREASRARRSHAPIDPTLGGV